LSVVNSGTMLKPHLWFSGYFGSTIGMIPPLCVSKLWGEECELTEIWARQLVGGGAAVLLFNRVGKARKITADIVSSQCGFGAEEIWSGARFGAGVDARVGHVTLESEVEIHGSAFYIVKTTTRACADVEFDIAGNLAGGLFGEDEMRMDDLLLLFTVLVALGARRVFSAEKEDEEEEQEDSDDISFDDDSE